MTHKMFQSLNQIIRRYYLREVKIYELGKILRPNELPMEEETLSFLLMKSALAREWEQRELDNLEHTTRIGYHIHLTKVQSKELMDGKPKWQLWWMCKTARATAILYNSL